MKCRMAVFIEDPSPYRVTFDFGTYKVTPKDEILVKCGGEIVPVNNVPEGCKASRDFYCTKCGVRYEVLRDGE